MSDSGSEDICSIQVTATIMEELNFSLDTTLVGALTVAFIICKAIGLINWSWLWILSPIWIAFLLTVLVVLFGKLFWKIVIWREQRSRTK
jgi:hypothetical protein